MNIMQKISLFANTAGSNDPVFSLPLLSNLALTKGSSTPTFTRATTATLKDFEGLLKTVKSGGIRLEGARRVENICTQSEFDTGWTGAGTTPPEVNKALTFLGKNCVSATFETGTYTLYTGSRAEGTLFPIVAGKTYNYRCAISASRVLTGDESILCYVTGSFGFGNIIFSTANNVSTSWINIAPNTSATSSATGNNKFVVTPAKINSPITIYLTERQFEEVSGQANQNPSEYISDGVIRRNLFGYTEDLSNAYWSKTGVTTGVDFLVETATSGVHVVSKGGIHFSGIKYVSSFKAKTNGQRYLVFWYSSLATTYAIGIDLQAGTFLNIGSNVTGTATIGMDGFWHITIITTTALSANSSLAIYLSADGNPANVSYLGDVGKGVYLKEMQTEIGDTVSAYQKITDASATDFNNYHGAGVDGVKYFTYKNGNTVLNNIVTEAQGIAIPESTIKGYFSEPVATNLYLQSATLATQNNTTTAQSYTVSFEGTGTVTFTGTYTGSLVGTGVNDRVSLTFSATAGTLTSTVSGSCVNGQLESGNIATSYIPTTTASVTKNADILSIPTAGNIEASKGSILLDFTPKHNADRVLYIASSYVDASNYTAIYFNVTGGVCTAFLKKRISGTDYNSTLIVSIVQDKTYKIGATWGSLGTRIYVDGVAGTPHANTGNIPLATTFRIGALSLSGQPIGNIKLVNVYQTQLSNAEMVILTT